MLKTPNDGHSKRPWHPEANESGFVYLVDAEGNRVASMLGSRKAANARLLCGANGHSETVAEGPMPARRSSEMERRALRLLASCGGPVRVTEVKSPTVVIRLARRGLIRLVAEITPAGRAALEEAGDG